MKKEYDMPNQVNTAEFSIKTLLTTASSLLIGAALLISAPTAFADRGDGWHKHQDRHQSHHNRKQDKKWHKHKNKERHSFKQNDRQRHDNPRFTRHHDKPKKHGHSHKPKNYHDSKHHFGKHHDKRHYRDRPKFVRDLHWDHYPSDSWFFSISSGIPVYDTPKYKTHYKRSVYERIENQQRRIRQGLNSGELTHREAKRLREDLHRIRHKMRHYRHDGRLNHYEKRHLHRMLDELSDRIYRKKHNNKKRYDDRDYHYYH